MTEDKKLLHWILKVTVGTLASITVAVVIVLLSGIFIESVDNKDIFAVISPAFNTVIGAFVGLLGGLSLGDNSNNQSN